VTEFERFLDNPESDLERMLLQAGRQSLADDRLRARTLTALGLAGSAALSTSFFATALGKKIMAGGLLASLGVGGAVTYYQVAVAAGRDAPAAVEPLRVQPAALSPRHAPDVRQEVPATVPVEEAAAKEEEARPAVVKRGSAKRSAPKPSIRDEVRALDGARSALSAGQPNVALSRLSDYSQKFPKGSLRMEAAVLRVKALAAAGHTQEASRRAQALVSRNPNSVVASRLRRYIVH